MAKYLLENSQNVVVFNIKGRTLSENINTLRRLASRRGIVYLIDMILAKKFKKIYQKPEIRIFPDINDRVIEDIRSRVDYYDIEDPHDEKTLNLTKRLSPDYILFLGAPVIKPSLFMLSRCGTINWHHGLSPLYRGSDCVLWAMTNNDFNNIGFTIHYVTEVVDGGKIILQRRVPVRKDLEFSEALADVLRQGMAGFIEVVQNILADKDIKGEEQVKDGVHYPPVRLSAVRKAYKNFNKYSCFHL